MDESIIRRYEMIEYVKQMYDGLDEFVSDKDDVVCRGDGNVRIHSSEAATILSHMENSSIVASFERESPCPFMSRGRCSIQEVRPIACRVHDSDLDEEDMEEIAKIQSMIAEYSDEPDVRGSLISMVRGYMQHAAKRLAEKALDMAKA